jgi:hypothetical protein
MSRAIPKTTFIRNLGGEWGPSIGILKNIYFPQDSHLYQGLKTPSQ